MGVTLDWRCTDCGSKMIQINVFGDCVCPKPSCPSINRTKLEPEVKPDV